MTKIEWYLQNLSEKITSKLTDVTSKGRYSLEVISAKLVQHKRCAFTIDTNPL